jgi:branched-chain amino acid transport system substrate-binding protein
MKMRKKKVFQWLSLGILMLTLIFVSTPTVLAKTIKIGVAGPFSGSAAGFGDNIKTGVMMKMEEINAAGGVNGMKLEVVWGDERCEPKEAGAVASSFAMDKNVLAVIGHVCSSPALTALPIYIRHGLVSISPTATNVTIGVAGKGWFFRNVYRDDFQGQFLANYVKKVLGMKRVAIFYENNDYAIGLQKAFSEEGKTLGIEVVGAEAYTSNTTDFGPQLTKILMEKPDSIFLCGFYQEGALIARQARAQGFNGPLFGADGIDNTEYIQIGGKAANNTYLTVPFLAEAAGPEAAAFIEKFKARTGRDLDWMSANAYDCVGILAEVISKVGPDRKKIRDGLAAMNSPETAYKGITGVTYFNDIGDCQKRAYVKMVKDGKYVPAKQLNE